MAEYRSIQVSRRARYLLSGETSDALHDVWFVLHGYAQRAEEFLREFEVIEGPGRLFVAPEGLSRFYRRGTTDEVGASWMTSVARLEEIEDYVAYLDAIYLELGLDQRPEVRINAIGFSQGCATAFRWSLLGSSRVDRLIGWAGDVPPDLDLEQLGPALDKLDLTLVYGKRDRLVSEDSVAVQVTRLRTAGVRHRLLRFDGAHRMDRETLRGLV